MPIRPMVMVPGSGVAEVGTPGTVTPKAVPNEKMAALAVVLAVTPFTAKVKVAVPFKKGLCGPFPLIEPLAFV